MKFPLYLFTVMVASTLLIGCTSPTTGPDFSANREDRSEVLFWHFWGGEDRAIVDDVVERFNSSQSEYRVRAIAMPGNNLQAKLFLSVAGGDPPDIVNQDDPVLADWGARGVIHALDEIAPTQEIDAVHDWMLDSARRLSTFDGRMYGVCNGLDIRALYYNKTTLDKLGVGPPTTIKQLDAIANSIAPFNSKTPPAKFGYLPDSRRLWAWGYVFGGDFFDSTTQTITVDSLEINQAMNWMASYATRYGADTIAAYRKGDQSLPGKTFPLLPISDDQESGRYTLVMDGQWRVRNIKAFQDRRRKMGLPVPEFGVCPLPTPTESSSLRPRKLAGWVNGNFFVFPKGAKNSAGAWAFAKFWIGLDAPDQAAQTCAAGGWIPVSQSVIEAPAFQNYLHTNPMFETFVNLASSSNQFPTPQVVGAAMFRRTIEEAAYESMQYPGRSSQAILEKASRQIQNHLNRSPLNRSRSIEPKPNPTGAH